MGKLHNCNSAQLTDVLLSSLKDIRVNGEYPVHDNEIKSITVCFDLTNVRHKW